MIKNNKKFLYSFIILFIFSIIINYLSIYNIILYKSIENTFRFIFIINIIIITLFFNIFLYKTNNKKHFTSISILFILYLIILIIVNYNLNNIYNKISNISSNSKIYSSSIVSNISNDNKDINKIKKIGIISDKNSIDGYIIPENIIEENKLNVELVYYEDYITMINDLLDKKIEYVFLPSNYKILFDNIEFNASLDTTKIIYSKKQEYKEKKKSNKKITEPFTILLMGVDSTEANINESSFNGDALMLLTYNPNTYTSTILSIPRDSYISISCFNNRKNKITHAAWNDENCIIDSLNNTFNINIDYFVKINFKGLVNLVDNLGGIEVNVPYSFCESNSERLWGNNTVYVDEGLQLLNGEQALALSRNRHPWPEFCESKWTNYNSNDIIRGNNQQLVLNGIIDRIKNIKSLDTIYLMLDTIKNNVSTNISTNNLLFFYNTSKDFNKIKFQKLFLNGYDSYIYDYDYINNKGTKLNLYNYVPYNKSIDTISKAMNDNLNGNLNVTDNIIGEESEEDKIILMPSFIGKMYTDAENFCNNHNIVLNVNYVDGVNNGIITYQSIQDNTDIEYVNNLSINVTKKKNNYNQEINNKKQDNKIENNNTQKNNDESIKQNENIKNENDSIKEDNNELDPIISEFIN